jgi:HK97 family phage major capsid protein
MLKPPHSWTKIRKALAETGSRVIGIGRRPTAQSIVEIDKEIADLLTESKKITDLATAEKRDPTEAELTRLESILDEDDGEIEALKAERDKAAKILALKKQQTRSMQDMERNRYSGLISKDEEDDEDEDEEGDNEDDDDKDEPKMKKGKSARARSTVIFRAQDGRKVRSLGVADPFCARAQRRSDDGRPRYSLGEMVAAHLGVCPLDGIKGSTVWEGSDGTGGYLTGVETFGTVIDMARAATVAFAAGAQIIPMNESELILVQQLTDPTPAWTPELGAVTGSAPTFGRIRLVPKKLACIVPVSIEILEDAQNAAQLIQSAITNAMALELDRAILSGTGTAEQPLGIRNVAAVNEHTIVSAPADDYSDLETAIEKIRLANYVGEDSALSWIRHPRDASQYNRLQDTLLQPLQPTPGAASLRKFQTTSLPINLGGGAASEMIIGDMSQVVVGMRTNATVRFLPAGTITSGGESLNAATQFATLIAVHMRADVAVIRPQWLTVIDGVTWS